MNYIKNQTINPLKIECLWNKSTENITRRIFCLLFTLYHKDIITSYLFNLNFKHTIT